MTQKSYLSKTYRGRFKKNLFTHLLNHNNSHVIRCISYHVLKDFLSLPPLNCTFYQNEKCLIKFHRLLILDPKMLFLFQIDGFRFDLMGHIMKSTMVCIVTHFGILLCDLIWKHVIKWVNKLMNVFVMLFHSVDHGNS